MTGWVRKKTLHGTWLQTSCQTPFLDASTQLYMRVRPSVVPSRVFFGTRKSTYLTNVTNLPNLTNLQICQNLINLPLDASLFERTCSFRISKKQSSLLTWRKSMHHHRSVNDDKKRKDDGAADGNSQLHHLRVEKHLQKSSDDDDPKEGEQTSCPTRKIPLRLQSVGCKDNDKDRSVF